MLSLLENDSVQSLCATSNWFACYCLVCFRKMFRSHKDSKNGKRIELGLLRHFHLLI